MNVDQRIIVMREYIEKIYKIKKMLSEIIDEGNRLIPKSEYLSNQERIDTFRNLSKGLDTIESIFKKYYYKYMIR